MFTAYINVAMKKRIMKFCQTMKDTLVKSRNFKEYGLMQTAWKLAVKN